MTRVTVKTTGFKEVEAALFELKSATAKGVARRVLKRVGGILKSKVEDLTPRSLPDQGLEGHAKDSYAVSSRVSRGAYRSERNERKGLVFMYVGTNSPVAFWQEFGTVNHAPRGYFRKAWAQTREEMLAQLSVQMRAEVDKAVARARRKAGR